MIIYFNKDTGHIEGATNGRLHGKEHLNMWIGDPEKTDRIIIEWKKVINVEGQGDYQMFEPDHEQAELLKEIEKYPPKIHEYKIDLETKKLIKNG